MSNTELSGSGGGGGAGEIELPAQLDGQLELHVEANRELLLVEGAGLQGGEAGEEMVTEPVLGMRMLMSSRVGEPWWLELCCAFNSVPYTASMPHTHTCK